MGKMYDRVYVNTRVPAPIDSTAAYVALVSDDTPESLEYGTYRGWVALDRDGGWLENLSVGQIESLREISWQESSEYERLGRLTR